MNSKRLAKWIKISLAVLAILCVLGAIYTIVSFYLQDAYIDSLPDEQKELSDGLGLAISLIYFRIPNVALNAISFIYSLALFIKFSNSVKKDNEKLSLVATIPFLIIILITLFFTYLTIATSVYFDIIATAIGVLQLAGAIFALVYSIINTKATKLSKEKIE